MKKKTFNLQYIEEELRRIARNNYGLGDDFSVWIISYPCKDLPPYFQREVNIGIGFNPLGSLLLKGEELTAVPALRDASVYSMEVDSISEGLCYLLSKSPLPLDS